MLSWDGEEVGQSVTIARFCAKKTGLAGKDDLEQARADAIVDQVIDCFAGMIGVIFASDSTSPVPASAPNRSEENKKVKGDDMFGNKFPHFLKVVDRHLKKNGGKWMVGESVSVVVCVCAIRFALFCRGCMSGHAFQSRGGGGGGGGWDGNTGSRCTNAGGLGKKGRRRDGGRSPLLFLPSSYGKRVDDCSLHLAYVRILCPSCLLLIFGEGEETFII